jgi:type IV pilus biogenesis protein PilP
LARAEPAAGAAKTTPQRAQAAARSSQPVSSRSLALIGIFGGAEGRHALVQLSDGSTKRVRQGDTLRGVQVTAIAADAVHLRAQGRDAVLRLPD